MVLKRIKALLKRRPKTPRSSAPEPDVQGSNAVPAIRAAAPPLAVHRGPEVVHHPVALQDLDPDAVRILKRLTRFDHAAYLVGGCVRDLLLERRPKDFDIGTSATPRQIKRLFSNCRIIGRRFRLAHIYFQNGKIIEVATFRAHDAPDNGVAADAGAGAGELESETGDDLLIRDDNVFGTPEQDAVRRDFTINALFYDANAETVIDHVDGLGDLRRRVVRTIGDPAVRFREDPIRILRAVKFAARLDFQIESRTLHALKQARSEIPKAAAPRILEEINRFCRGGAAKKSFELALETGVFEVILPELAAAYSGDGPERACLFALLDAIDSRWQAEREIATGEIFAALMFAAAAPGLGWSLEPGRPATGGSLDARTIVDEQIRPLALRLRIARKDQERVRQTLATLHRMVPARPMRRPQRIAFLRRPSFLDALALLDALAPVLGGDFAAARESWSRLAESHGAPEPAETASTETVGLDEESGAPPETDEGPKRRRRGRRGGRGRRRPDDASRPPSAEGVAAKEPRAPRPTREPKPAAPSMPPVWDDSYFFAALPSVPEIDPEERDTDRYGAASVASIASAPAARAETEGDDPGDGSGGSEAKPRRRRRRGGRRHKKAGPILPSDGSPAPAGGEA